MIDVFCEGIAGRGGHPVRHRPPHPPPAVPQAARPQHQSTGVDYLGLVAAAHDGAGWYGRDRLRPGSPCSTDDDTDRRRQ